jgi:succinate dehydrogenase / fumarate reductase iron-sulfur subunit
MAQFRLPPNSRIVAGVTHRAPAGTRGVRTFRIYRFNPDSGENPRLDTFEREWEQTTEILARFLSPERES